MSSPGIDDWVKREPASWAKLAKKGKGKQSFEEFKKKFFEGAESENKGYLRKYLTDEQLKHIFVEGAGGEITKGGASPIQPKPIKTKLEVTRKGKQYTRSNTQNWRIESKFVLQLAAKSKPKSDEYYKYLDILISQGRTRQAAVKKIQRTRKGMKN